MEAKLYEMLGRKQAHIEQLVGDNHNLLRLVQALKDGDIDPRCVRIAGDRVEVIPLDETAEAVERN